LATDEGSARVTGLRGRPREAFASDQSRGQKSIIAPLAHLSASHLLVSILLIALGLRALRLGEQSLSMDEVAELTIGQSAVRDILFAHDGFPPLYNTVLHGWLTLFPGDLAARWLSVLLGTLSVWAVWGIARRAGGDRTALWTALLVAVSPFHIWHSQESRAYILYYLLAALALWSFFTALETNSRRAWLGYVAAALAGLLTHYYFALLVLANVAILLVEFRGRGQWRRAIVAHAALGAASLPVLWLLQGDLASEAAVPFATKFHPVAIGYTLFSFLAGYAIGPSPSELHGLPAGRAALEVLPWLIPTGLAAGVLLFQGLRVLGMRRWGRRLVLATGFPVIACVLAAGLLGITFQVRHVLWASIPLMVVLGAGASQARGNRAVVLAVVTLFVLFGVSRYRRHSLPQYQNEDVRGLAAYLRTMDRASPLLVLSGYMAAPIRHYLGDAWRIYPVPNIGSNGDGLPEALRYVESTVPSGSTFWLAYTREFHGDPQGRFLDSLARIRSLQRRTEFAGVVLYAGAAEPAASR
jgi:mannosyltransferase